MNPSPRIPCPAALGRRLLSFLALLFVPLALTAAEAKFRFNVPAGEAGQTLKLFAQQAGREIMFAAKPVESIRTNAVQGELTAQDAIELLLADTGLVATVDTKTGAYAVRRETAEEAKNALSRPADAATAANARITDGAVQLEEIEVRGTRVDGLNNKGLLQGGADAALYHDVVTRVDIERMGVTSLEELFRQIPQTSSARVSFQTNDATTQVSGGLTSRFSTMGLRGFNSTQTVILINGRALPRSSPLAGGGADLSRIPLAAIERVEIMPYAGSAIYGAGAIGGAINVILRKGYSGQEITTYVGTTTDGGASEYKLTVLDGRTFHDNRGRITTTLNFQHRDPLRAEQRGFLARAAAKFTPTNTAVLDATGLTPYESFILPAYAGMPATIVASAAPTAAVNDLGIPGAPGVRWALVPPGTTAAGSLTLTPASFTGTAGQAAPAGSAPRNGRNVLYEPIDAYNVNSQVEYDILRDDRLTAYGEFTYGFTSKKYSFPQFSAVSLSATDPLNPFRTGVTPGFVGRAVTVYFDTPDIQEPSAAYEYESARAVIGLKGKLTDRFDWSVDGAIDYAHNTVDSDNPPQNVLLLSSLSLSSAGAQPAAVRRAIYPILADHTQYPVSAQTAQDHFYNVRYFASHTVQQEGNARIVGDLWDLPAGPLRASIFTKYQEWSNTSGQIFHNTPAIAQLAYGGTFPENVSASDMSREVLQGALELSIPVISEKWRPIPVEGFELQASASRERNVTMQPGRNDNKQDGDSNVLAGKLQLTKDIAFRASYSEGFYPPDWNSVQNPFTTQTVARGTRPDPLRGNTVQVPGFSLLSGGNPDLKPEQATSENFGVIFTPRWFPKLSLNIDFWRIEKIDAVLTVGWPNSISNPQLYGFLITRAAPTPAEQALGWAGVVTEIDQRPINASRTRTEGVDFRLRYTVPTQSMGSFEFNANGSFTNNFLLKVTPTAPEVDTAGGSGPLRWRANGSVTWNVRPWTVTLGARYVGHFSTGTTAPSESYPSAIPYDGGRIPAYMHYDLQVAYEVPNAGTDRGWRGWLRGTKFTVGANNVLNTEPDFMTGFGLLGSGQSYYNSYDDPRQRFIYLSINKSL